VDIQMLIENNLFNNGGSAIELFDGSPAPAFKSTGNIGTAKNISMSQGTVFTPPYTLTLKLNAAEVEAKVKPAAGNTLTYAATRAGKRPAAHCAKCPSVVPGKTGWILYNASESYCRFSLVTLGGRTVLAPTRLEAGGRFSLPEAGIPLYMRIDAAKDGKGIPMWRVVPAAAR
jgi:hypothetical protein